jgi:glycosyltransferase involved in cell wall biosynthesis
LTKGGGLVNVTERISHCNLILMGIQRGKKKAIVIKANLTDRDPWLAKIMDTLQRGGYAVTLLGWDRDVKPSGTLEKGTAPGYEEIALRMKAPWGTRVVLYYPIWWCFVFYQLLKTPWDIAQAINMDCIGPSWLAARLKRRPVVYQIFDFYVDIVALPGWLRRLVIATDKAFMRLANAVIITNEYQEKEINGIPNKTIVTIYNPPPDVFISEKPRGDVFTLFYAGVLYRLRMLNLDKVFKAIEGIDGVRLIIAGYGDMDEEIKEWVRQADGKAEFLGKISYEEVLQRTLASDLLFGLYSAKVRSQKYAASANKLSEAMMAHKPIIVTRDTAISDMVERENCGLAVDPENVAEIRQAIVRLKDDPDLYHRLGENGRRAYEQKYNRDIMEKRQLDLLDKLLKPGAKG